MPCEIKRLKSQQLSKLKSIIQTRVVREPLSIWNRGIRVSHCKRMVNPSDFPEENRMLQCAAKSSETMPCTKGVISIMTPHLIISNAIRQ